MPGLRQNFQRWRMETFRRGVGEAIREAVGAACHDASQQMRRGLDAVGLWGRGAPNDGMIPDC